LALREGGSTKAGKKKKCREIKATGPSTKNRKVVLVPVFLVQKPSQYFA